MIAGRIIAALTPRERRLIRAQLRREAAAAERARVLAELLPCPPSGWDNLEGVSDHSLTDRRIV